MGSALTSAIWRRHRRFARAIDPYLDGELAGGEAATVAAHLRDCPGCSADAETTRLLKRSLRQVPGRQPASLARARLERLVDHLSHRPAP